MLKIFIVEDDPVIARAISGYLSAWGYETRCAEDLKNVLHEFAEFSPQLVLMDISLPFFSGFHWCKEIRAISKAPVIFVSSANDNMSVVMAVNMGGDDFISKPFELEVLTAKVQAVLRRTYDYAGQTGLIAHGGAVLSTADASLAINGERVELTKNEYRILEVLMENIGNTVSRDTLMTKLWETDSYIDENALTVNMTRLRKKLDQYDLSDFIRTKRGIGYIIE